MRRNVTLLFALNALIVLAQLVSLAAAATTNTTTNPFEKAVTLSEKIAGWLQKIAYAVVAIAFFIGVIHWAFGRGPEWLSRAIMAAFLISAGMWIIGYFIGK